MSNDIDTIALNVARRFTSDHQPKRRAMMQVAIIEAIKRAAPSPPADAAPVELIGVGAAIAGGGGLWRTCTGCHEHNEGNPTGPLSQTMQCHLGGGCDECGGIGAIWDTTDYQAMADDMAAGLLAPAPGVGGAVTPHREWRSALTLAVEVMESEAAMQVEGGHDAYAARMKRAMAVMRSMLTAPPAPQGDARDAERYRWLRDHYDDVYALDEQGDLAVQIKAAGLIGESAQKLDTAIDAAIAAQAGEKSNG